MKKQILSALLALYTILSLLPAKDAVGRTRSE